MGKSENKKASTLIKLAKEKLAKKQQDAKKEELPDSGLDLISNLQDEIDQHKGKLLHPVLPDSTSFSPKDITEDGLYSGSETFFSYLRLMHCSTKRFIKNAKSIEDFDGAYFSRGWAFDPEKTLAAVETQSLSATKALTSMVGYPHDSSYVYLCTKLNSFKTTAKITVTDIDIVNGIKSILKTGKIPESLHISGSFERFLTVLTYHLFGTEVERHPAAAIHNIMALDLVQTKGLNWAFQNLPMAIEGATPVARGIQITLHKELALPYYYDASDTSAVGPETEEFQDFIMLEQELVSTWLKSKGLGSELTDDTLTAIDNLCFEYYGIRLAAEKEVDREDGDEVKNLEQVQGEGISEHYDSSYWYIYTKAAMDRILELRLQSANIDANHGRIIHPNYIFNEANAVAFTQDLVAQISAVEIGEGNNAKPTLLIPVNINNQHWVGMTVEFIEGNIIITYMDSEANPMPESLNEQLRAELVQLYPNTHVEIVEKVVEVQQYNNCGLEVIENLIAVVTKEEVRIPQEEVAYIHSVLYEQYLIEEACKAQKSTTILEEEAQANGQAHNDTAVINPKQDAIEVVSSDASPQNIERDSWEKLMDKAWQEAQNSNLGEAAQDSWEQLMDEAWEQATNPEVTEVMAGKKLEGAELEAMHAAWEAAQASTTVLVPNVSRTTDRETAQQTTYLGGLVKSVKDSMRECYSIITKVNPNDVISAMNSMMELFPIRPSCGVRAYDYVEPVPERLEVFNLVPANVFEMLTRNDHMSSSEMLNFPESVQTVGGIDKSWVE